MRFRVIGNMVGTERYRGHSNAKPDGCMHIIGLVTGFRTADVHCIRTDATAGRKANHDKRKRGYGLFDRVADSGEFRDR